MTKPTCMKVALVGIFLVLLSGCMSPQGATIADKRHDAMQMRSDTLAKLYSVHPGAREQIAKAAG